MTVSSSGLPSLEGSYGSVTVGQTLVTSKNTSYTRLIEEYLPTMRTLSFSSVVLLNSGNLNKGFPFGLTTGVRLLDPAPLVSEEFDLFPAGPAKK